MYCCVRVLHGLGSLEPPPSSSLPLKQHKTAKSRGLHNLQASTTSTRRTRTTPSPLRELRKGLKQLLCSHPAGPPPFIPSTSWVIPEPHTPALYRNSGAVQVLFRGKAASRFRSFGSIFSDVTRSQHTHAHTRADTLTCARSLRKPSECELEMTRAEVSGWRCCLEDEHERTEENERARRSSGPGLA